MLEEKPKTETTDDLSCNEFKKIVQTVESVEEGQESLAELNQRIKINEHLSKCQKYPCYLERVNRINQGLF